MEEGGVTTGEAVMKLGSSVGGATLDNKLPGTVAAGKGAFGIGFLLSPLLILNNRKEP